MDTNFVKDQINIPSRKSDTKVSLTLGVDALVHLMDVAEDYSGTGLSKPHKRSMGLMAGSIRAHLREHYPDVLA